jgi:Protein of unknown function (DUF3168)
MIEMVEGLVAYLNQIPEIQALCGNRIYGARRPQGERPLPEILISPITRTGYWNFCGPADLVSCDLQIDSYGYGLADAGAMAKQLRKTLDDTSGIFGSVVVNKVFLSNQLGAVDTDPGTVRMVQTFTFWYLED